MVVEDDNDVMYDTNFAVTADPLWLLVSSGLPVVIQK